MKQVSCKDLGSECGFIATGETDQQVKDKMMEHAWADHKEEMEKMSEEDMRDANQKMDDLLSVQS